MAELLLKINDGSNYIDGDCLCAFNDRHILCTHAQQQCHLDVVGKNAVGLRARNSVAEDIRELTCQYRFERISEYEIDRVNLSDNSRERLTGPEFDCTVAAGPVVHVTHTEIMNDARSRTHKGSHIAVILAAESLGFTNVAFAGNDLLINGVSTAWTSVNTNTEFMNVPEFIKRRRKHERHALFSDVGESDVVWYGGRTDFSDAVVSAVWDRIEPKIGRLRTEQEFTLWPMGRLDIRHHLAIRTTNFTDAQAEEWVAPQYELDGNGDPILYDDQGNPDPEGNPKVISKRNINIDWRSQLLDDLGVTETLVLDRTYPVGRDIVIDQARMRHESKSQPLQSDRGKFNDKAQGGPLT